LRWLDSTLGMNDTVVAPYTPLEISGQTVKCLGRQVAFGDDGLPNSIKTGTSIADRLREVLAGPIWFVVETEKGLLPVFWKKPTFSKQTEGAVIWETAGTADGLVMNCRATMEFDGHIGYEMTLHASKPMSVKNIRLEIPYRRDAAVYQAGMGSRGGYRSPTFTSTWSNG